MKLEDFADALDEIGVSHRLAGASIVCKSCPSCGNDRYKVHIRASAENGLFFGRCYAGSCQENYSSIKYLLNMGMEYPRVMQVHGLDAEKALQRMTPSAPEAEVEPEEAAPAEEGEAPETDISSFFKLKDWLEHPVSQYALSRGARPEWDSIMIDHASSAVVFVVKDGHNVAGFQRRFLFPSDPHTKSKTSRGFKKSQHVLVFIKPGRDILVCEGPFTAISAWHYGYTGVCTFGASVSDLQIAKIVELANLLGVNVGVAFDDDKAGEKAMARVRAGMFWSKKETFRVRPSVGNDLNDAWQAGGTAEKVEETFQYNPAVPPLKGFC